MINRDTGADDDFDGTSYPMGDVGDMAYVLESEELVFDVCLRASKEGLPFEAVIEIDEKENANTLLVQSYVGLDSDECRRVAEILLEAAAHLDRQTVPGVDNP